MYPTVSCFAGGVTEAAFLNELSARPLDEAALTYLVHEYAAMRCGQDLTKEDMWLFLKATDDDGSALDNYTVQMLSIDSCGFLLGVTAGTPRGLFWGGRLASIIVLDRRSDNQQSIIIRGPYRSLQGACRQPSGPDATDVGGSLSANGSSTHCLEAISGFRISFT